LAGFFKPVAPGVWEYTPTKPATTAGTLRILVKDKQWNVTKLERAFRAGP
jgi:hypothetical protein